MHENRRATYARSAGQAASLDRQAVLNTRNVLPHGALRREQEFQRLMKLVSTEREQAQERPQHAGQRRTPQRLEDEQQRYRPGDTAQGPAHALHGL